MLLLDWFQHPIVSFRFAHFLVVCHHFVLHLASMSHRLCVGRHQTSTSFGCNAAVACTIQLYVVQQQLVSFQDTFLQGASSLSLLQLDCVELCAAQVAREVFCFIVCCFFGSRNMLSNATSSFASWMFNCMCTLYTHNKHILSSNTTCSLTIDRFWDFFKPNTSTKTRSRNAMLFSAYPEVPVGTRVCFGKRRQPDLNLTLSMACSATLWGQTLASLTAVLHPSAMYGNCLIRSRARISQGSRHVGHNFLLSGIHATRDSGDAVRQSHNWKRVCRLSKRILRKMEPTPG